MTRTCLRPIPTCKIKKNYALIYGLILTFVSVVSLNYFTNTLSALLLLFTILFYGCPDPDPDDGDSIDPNSQNCGSIDYYDLYLEGIPIPEEFVFNSDHLNNIDVINQVYTLTTDSSLSSDERFIVTSID